MLELTKFDKHLDNIKKIKKLDKISLKEFYKQFTFCHYKTNPNFWKIYNYFKKSSRHLIQKQLNLF